MDNVSKILKVIKYEVGLFYLWLVFTLLFSAIGIFIDVFLAENSLKMWSTQIKNQVFYIVAISLLSAYVADSLSLLKIDGEFLGKNTDKKEYFYNEKIFITASGFILIIFILIAYVEKPYNGCFQIIYLLLTLSLGIFLFALKHYHLAETKIEQESVKDVSDQANEDAKEDMEKIK